MTCAQAGGGYASRLPPPCAGRRESVSAPLFVYRWRNNPKRQQLYRRVCRVVRRLSRNSALVKFADGGQLEVVSRNALRKGKETKPCGSSQ